MSQTILKNGDLDLDLQGQISLVCVILCESEPILPYDVNCSLII